MGISLKNWDRAGKLFQFTVPEVLDRQVETAVQQASNLYSEAILDIIAEQPSDWTDKSESWRNQSGSSDLFYGKTGSFVMSVADSASNSRGVRAKYGDRKVFVGARPDKVHSASGFSMEQIANILQATPDGSRDLFGRAYERVEDQINKVFSEIGTHLF